MDYTTMTEDELNAVIDEASAELRRRSAIAGAERRVRTELEHLLTDLGVQDGQEWQPLPLGYPKGHVVTHDDKTYRSLINSNVWEPGDTSDPQYYRWWEDITPQPEPEPGTTPAWDGDGHAYTTGDRVTFEGAEYECLQGHTSQPDWTPDAVASLWTPVEGSTT